MPLQWASEEKAQQLGCDVVDPRRVRAEFAIQPQSQRIGKPPAEHASLRDCFAVLPDIVQPGRVDFEVEQMATTGLKPVSMNLGAWMPDHRARRAGPLFLPGTFHVGTRQEERN